MSVRRLRRRRLQVEFTALGSWSVGTVFRPLCKQHGCARSQRHQGHRHHGNAVVVSHLHLRVHPAFFFRITHWVWMRVCFTSYDALCRTCQLAVNWPAISTWSPTTSARWWAIARFLWPAGERLLAL